MIKLCIFDMDGLLIDSERYMWAESMATAAAEQGKVLTDELHARIMGLNHADESIVMKRELGDDFDTELFFNRTYELNKEIMKNGIPLMKGTIELLEYCKANNIKTCIGTRTPRLAATNILRIDKIDGYFDDMVCGDEVVNGKPNPEIYEKCFNKFNFDKSEAVVFEDAESGGKAAIGAGIRLVLVPDLAHLSDEIKASAYKIIDNLSEMIDIIKEENERATSI